MRKRGRFNDTISKNCLFGNTRCLGTVAVSADDAPVGAIGQEKAWFMSGKIEGIVT